MACKNGSFPQEDGGKAADLMERVKQLEEENQKLKEEIAKGRYDRRGELFNAVEVGHIPAVDALRKSGVDIIGSRRDNGMSSILLACKIGHSDLLAYLLEQGASPNDSEYYGGTCLMAASCYSHPDCVRRLIDAGADTKYAYSGDNATVVYMTVYCFVKDAKRDGEEFNEGNTIRTVEMLLDAGAPGHTPTNGINSSGNTALEMLQDMKVRRSHHKVKRERDGLIALLRGHTDP